LKMNDKTFMKFDDKLYSFIESYIINDFELNADQETFNKFCFLRDQFIDLIDNTNDKIKNQKNFWK